ncbi:MAG: hypothetical protein AAB507_01225 [Patescibacteria group bacterium]
MWIAGKNPSYEGFLFFVHYPMQSIGLVDKKQKRPEARDPVNWDAEAGEARDPQAPQDLLDFCSKNPKGVLLL